ARYYDPDTARFINEDTYLGESNTPPSLHRYLYAYGNPTVYIDPDGHIVWFAVIAYVAATAANSAVDTAVDVAIDETINAATGQESTTSAESVGKGFLTNFAGNLVTGNTYGKAKNVKRAADVADAVKTVNTRKKQADKARKANKADNVEDAATSYTPKPTVNTRGSQKKSRETVDAKKQDAKSQESLTKAKDAGPSKGTNRVEEKRKSANRDDKGIDPDLRKRADGFKAYKRKKGMSSDEKVSPDQYKNFRRGNTGDNGGGFYKPKVNYRDPQIHSSTGKGMNNPKVKAAATRGREAHKEFAEKVKQKPGWKSEKTITGPNGEILRPDALTPSGRPVELKPNTPTGRRQGEGQIKKYKEATGKNGRVIYYDP
ncbi:RHS repeat-associated core domain-containing protein, partial [Arenicella chitinivorans]|uniref:RHS repeat-associated core domain-containing protein n=1 Tax=Arenicella chitinivorans TaxID=1329800 RepID=UPI001E3F3D6A